MEWVSCLIFINYILPVLFFSFLKHIWKVLEEVPLMRTLSCMAWHGMAWHCMAWHGMTSPEASIERRGGVLVGWLSAHHSASQCAVYGVTVFYIYRPMVDLQAYFSYYLLLFIIIYYFEVLFIIIYFNIYLFFKCVVWNQFRFTVNFILASFSLLHF